MGLMDKAKQAALQAKDQAQHMAQQGQAKVADVQHGRQEGELFRALGEAYFNEQRKGGDHAAVDAALAAIDAHLAGVPAATEAAAPGAAAPGGAASGEPMAPGQVPPPPSPASPPAGDFTLDDV